MKKRVSLIFLAIVVFMLCRCCFAPRYNAPLESPVDFNVADKAKQDPQTLMGACFSGGGSRAMAMGYYVCEAFRNVKYSDSTNLMDEIDLASGVSGGSFVAAALPIYKNDWKEFEKLGVKCDIQGNVIKGILKPWNWPYLASPYYTRTNLASEFYDTHIFKGHTFGTIPQHPKIYINATLLAQGIHFVYNEKYFKLINSDISSYPIGYACAASSAFPVGFAAMTLKNYPPELPEDALMAKPEYRMAYLNQVSDINQYRFKQMWDFLNNKENAWIHNQDGGLAGNTGIKRFLDEFRTNGVINKAINNSDMPMKRFIIVVIDAGTKKIDKSCRDQSPPLSMEVIMYTTTTAMDVLSGERLSELKSKMDELWQNAQAAQSSLGFSMKSLSMLQKPYLIEINARNIFDEKLLAEFNDLPTSFHMKEKQLETIRKSVNYLLKSNKEYKRLLQDLGVSID